MNNLDDFALGRNVFFADLQHQHFAFVVSQRMVEPGEHFVSPGRVERTAEHTVLDMVEAVVLAYVGDSEPDLVVRNVIDNEGKQILPAHASPFE